MTLDSATLAVFLPAAALVASTPGANNLLALSYGIKAGFRPTVVSLLGRMCAFAILIALVAVGLGAVVAASQTAFTVIKWFGVLYLVWLGVGMWRTPVHEAGEVPDGTGLALARRAFWVALANPKSILIFTAFIPQFMSPDGNWAVDFTVLSAIYLAVEFCFACGYTGAGASMRRLKLTASRMRWANRITGGTMIGAAGLLAITQK
ncbi:LysE family translocator [Acuticoccus sp. I52.16.1]|uniref:LysE family translocator n=1 Tax=Acuticoccus sp. I52.16.1 TaxID=2928472 RepID=UPI001FD01964|nr:LysE family translocator [Acuticoccus sp. I52.16.1]UOM35132.1 LysE family translocator [Acuticoccus sp. I52.16.1]